MAKQLYKNIKPYTSIRSIHVHNSSHKHMTNTLDIYCCHAQLLGMWSCVCATSSPASRRGQCHVLPFMDEEGIVLVVVHYVSDGWEDECSNGKLAIRRWVNIEVLATREEEK